jgi:hypothetical protein
MLMKARRVLLCAASLLALVLQASGPASAQDVAAAARANRARKEAEKAKGEDNEWYTLTHASLRVTGEGATLFTLYELSGNGDMRVTIDATGQGKHESGEVMLIMAQRQWMLAKGIPLEEGYEIDVLDGPVLDLQLALELLRAAVPNGPSGIKEKTTLDVKEDSRPMTVSTASASGGFEAPWSLHATIAPSAEGQWSFELSVKDTEGTMRMSGTWQKAATPPAFADDMPLDGWQILRIGPIKRTEGNSTIFDYGAQPSDTTAKTLGELRKM